MLAHLDINKIAIAVFKIIVKDSFIKANKDAIRASAWYNGRERGICLRVRPGGSWTSSIEQNIVFGENRNSDAVFIDTWQDVSPFNPPTIKDMPESAYLEREFVNAMSDKARAQKAAKRIIQMVKTCIKSKATNNTKSVTKEV